MYAVGLAVVAQYPADHRPSAVANGLFVFQNNEPGADAADSGPLLRATFNGFGESPHLSYRDYGRGPRSGYGGLGALPGNGFEFGHRRTPEGFGASPVNGFVYATDAAGFGGHLDARHPFAAPQFPLQFPIRFDGPNTVSENFLLPPLQEYARPETPETVQQSEITPQQSEVTAQQSEVTPQQSEVTPQRSDATESVSSNDAPNPSQQQSYQVGDGLQDVRSAAEKSLSNISPSSVTPTATEAPVDLILELRPPAENSVPVDYSKFLSAGSSPHDDYSTPAPVDPIDSVSGSSRNGRGYATYAVAVPVPGNAAAAQHYNRFVVGNSYPVPNQIPVNVPVPGAKVQNSRRGPYNNFPGTFVTYLTPSAGNAYTGQFSPTEYAVNGNSSPGIINTNTVPAGGHQPVLNRTGPNTRYNEPNIIPNRPYKSIFNIPSYNSGENAIFVNGNVKPNGGNIYAADSNSLVSNGKREPSNNENSSPNNVPLYLYAVDYKNSQ